MTRLFSTWCVLLLSGLLFPQWTSAQWVTNTAVNTPVSSSVTEDVKSVRGSDGSTYVAYWHNVPAPQYYEMRLQKLDSSGVQQFGANGMLVNGTIAMSSYIVTWDLAIDNSNNVYIAMTGTGSGNPGVVHKISSSGTQMWGTSGASVGAGYDLKLLPLSNGSVVVSYLPGTQGQIVMLDAMGAPVWTGPKSLVPVNSGYRTLSGEMVEITGNKFEVIYYEQAGFSPYGLPYVKCYDFSGSTVWSNPTALTNSIAVQTNKRHSVCQSLDTVYFGFAGSMSTDIQCYIQRINPDGTIPWGINGVDFASQSVMFERDIRIATDEQSSVVWAIAEFTQSTQANVGEYVQKLDRQTGARLLGPNAQVVFAVGGLDRSHKGELRLQGGLPNFLVTDGLSNGVTAVDIWLIQLDANGILDPVNGILPMATNASGIKSRINLADIVHNQAVAVWAENRGGSSLPYAHKLTIIPCTAPDAAFYGSVNGLSVDFSQTGTPADSVYWDFGDGTTLSDTSQMVTHTYGSNGTYNVCRTVFNDCGSDTLCVSVEACLEATAQFSYTVHGDSVYFTVAGTQGDTVYWDFDDGTNTSASGTGTSHVYSANGTYTVVYYTANDCSEDSVEQQIIITGIGIGENTPDEPQLTVWPNPAGDLLNVTLSHSGNATDETLLIYNTAGVCAGRHMIRMSNGVSEISLPVSELPSGVYVLKTGSGTAVTRFAVKR